MKVAIAFAALVLAAPAIALASDDGEALITRKETVRYMSDAADTREGAEALYAQIKRASRRVCADSVRAGNPQRVDMTCAGKAMDRAIKEAGKPLLTALHGERNADDVLLAERVD